MLLEHSQVLGEYRAAQAQVSGYKVDPEDTQRLDNALGHYRVLFEDLLQAPPAAA